MLFALPSLPEQHTQVVERIDRLRNRLRFLLQGQPRRWTGLLRRSTFARAIQGSNSIEGYHVTVDDAVAAVDGEEPLDERGEAWKAVTGYRNAMSYVLALADDAYYQHNEGTLKSLHYMMLGYDVTKHPGRWRPGSATVRLRSRACPVRTRREYVPVSSLSASCLETVRPGTSETPPSSTVPDDAPQPISSDDGSVVYEGPSADLVPPLMSELMTSLNAASPLPVMVRAALAHLNLVMVHPFSDGNGRMARALQSFVLAREGILDPTFSSIEEYLGHNTPAYYDVLGQVGQGAWHPKNDPLRFVTFCLTAHYRQAEKLLQRTDETARLWALLEAETQRRGLHERTMLALSDAAFGFRVRNATYRTAAEISDPLASRDLRALVDAGLLVPHGERRGRHYVASEWLLQARTATRSVTVTTNPFTDEVVRVLPEDRQGRLPM
jgi:Fic family protein